MIDENGGDRLPADCIHMNSWILACSRTRILSRSQRGKTAERFHPPLDIVDGAARIVDPIVDGIIRANTSGTVLEGLQGDGLVT